MWAKVLSLCEALSNVTYENLTKIIRYSEAGSRDKARLADDSYQNNVDHWMGGGTCFSMTWHLFQELKALGFSPRLLMGHKRKEKNIHCALFLSYEGREYLLDPGYLIFEPLEIPVASPFGSGVGFFPLVPNCVRLERTDKSLSLFTGSASAPLKLRFEFNMDGVDEKEFQFHWSESFEREMMTYPVLNRLDKEKGIQYYYQKSNLVLRDRNGSRIEPIADENKVSVLSSLFKLPPETVERALGILGKTF
jgi:arylamine N-acetyltransferase